MAKKKEVWEPIIIEGREISRTWWGRAWCQNLDRYADYDNRLPRGKTYVRKGAVRDLRIEEGVIRGRVQGSRPHPYKVEIHVKPLPDEKVKRIEETCSEKFESMDQFLKGEFPKEFQDFFTATDLGLFPSIREIAFGCSCPDWAVICKHVASVIYGVGRKLDDDPLLLFRLRGVDTDRLSGKIISRALDEMLEKTMLPLPEGREMDIRDAAELFGIDSYDEAKLNDD